MIPKKIHYCWFGRNPLPEDVKKYIDSWKKYCPDYEIIEWNEDNFDVNSVPYVKEAYESRKWAFVTDYVRLYALYHQGGIYMDTDVEVLKPLDEFLKEEAFFGFERADAVGMGTIGSVQQSKVIADLLSDYDNRRFINEKGDMDLTTNVDAVTVYFKKEGVKMNNEKQTINGFTIYPCEYFSPKNSRTLKIEVTDNSHTIHHFAGTWVGEETRFRQKIKKLLGPKLCAFVVKIMDKLGIK